MKSKYLLKSILVSVGFIIAGCNGDSIESTGIMDVTESESVTTEAHEVPYEYRWGIYSLDLTTQGVDLIFSSQDEMTSLRQSPAEDRFVFSMKVGGGDREHTEIFTLGMDGSDLQQLTDNNQWDGNPGHYAVLLPGQFPLSLGCIRKGRYENLFLGRVVAPGVA